VIAAFHGLSGDRNDGGRRRDSMVVTGIMETPNPVHADIEAEELPDVLVPTDIGKGFSRRPLSPRGARGVLRSG
jgi:hypothetical protein